MVQFNVGRVSGTQTITVQKVSCVEGSYIIILKVNYMMTAVIPACESSPCANGANCTSMGPFDFTCQCAVGYTGSTCEVNIDDCVSVTCPSNSVCEDRVDAFVCVCLSGFEKINGTCVMVLQTESFNAGQCYFKTHVEHST